MPIFEREGVRVGYQVQGSGPPVVLGHSLLCDGRMWADVVPALARRYRVINVDFRGHGASTAPRPFTMEDLAEDWLAILDRESIERAALVGLSMGAMTAMRVALRAPDRVGAMVLLNTSADPETKAKRLQYLAMAEIGRRIWPARFLTAVVGKIMFGRTAYRSRPDLIAEEVARIEQLDPHQLFHAIVAVCDRRSIHDRLRELRCPTLVVVGDEDVATPPPRGERIVTEMTHASLKRLPRVGHLSAREAPDVVAKEVEAFLGPLSW